MGSERKPVRLFVRFGIFHTAFFALLRISSGIPVLIFFGCCAKQPAAGGFFNNQAISECMTPT